MAKDRHEPEFLEVASWFMPPAWCIPIGLGFGVLISQYFMWRIGMSVHAWAIIYGVVMLLLGGVGIVVWIRRNCHE